MTESCYKRTVRRIGYMVSEFPGQTHHYFWRELPALRERGIEPDLISTRLPPRGIVSHSWAREAMAKTTYLAPPTAGDLAATLAELARAAPAGWARCAASIGRAQGIGARGRLRLMALAVMGGRLASLARARGLSHVHVHSAADAAHVALFAHLLSELPYSLTLHARLVDFGPNQREKWRHAQFAIVLTERLRHEVQEALSGSLPQHVEIAPMGVALDDFSRRAPYEPWTAQGPLRVFSCGRLNPAKGHQELIEAVERLRAKGLDVRLSIAGEDEAGGTGYRKVLEAQIAARRLEGTVRLLGAVPAERVRDELEGAHVFSLATHHEGVGVAVMEAMAMRVPVVATRVGGIPDLVDDGENGLLVEPERPAELAERIEAVARDRTLSRQLGDRARGKAESAFGIGRSADALAKHLVGSAPPAAHERIRESSISTRDL